MKHLHTLILVAGLLSAGAVSEARQAAPQRPSPGMFVAEARDARQTRERLNEVLEQHPPSLREVLRIDPTLLYNDNYLATYPALAAFLQQHPEVAHNPRFFIGESRVSEENRNDPRLEAARALGNFVEGLTVVMVVMTISLGVIFLVRTVVEHRRWQRASKAQAELNNKLIDRFADAFSGRCRPGPCWGSPAPVSCSSAAGCGMICGWWPRRSSRSARWC